MPTADTPSPATARSRIALPATSPARHTMPSITSFAWNVCSAGTGRKSVSTVDLSIEYRSTWSLPLRTTAAASVPKASSPADPSASDTGTMKSATPTPKRRSTRDVRRH